MQTFNADRQVSDQVTEAGIGLAEGTTDFKNDNIRGCFNDSDICSDAI